MSYPYGSILIISGQKIREKSKFKFKEVTSLERTEKYRHRDVEFCYDLERGGRRVLQFSFFPVPLLLPEPRTTVIFHPPVLPPLRGQALFRILTTVFCPGGRGFPGIRKTVYKGDEDRYHHFPMGYSSSLTEDTNWLSGY